MDENVAVAIVGAAGRFPGANNLSSWWGRVRAGEILTSRFAVDDIADAGIRRAVAARVAEGSKYVPVRGRLQRVYEFDASLFGYGGRDAALLDPQQRVLLELSWQTFEHAGYSVRELAGERVGVFASLSLSTHGLAGAYAPSGFMGMPEDIEWVLNNSSEFAATRIAYHFDLRGPAVAVQTACSSSLVAMASACTSLVAGECEAALVAAAGITLPQELGHFYTPDGIRSLDGYTRPFDETATGFVRGNGACVVLLKRLTDAVADGDLILAVVEGWAVNNDGARRPGLVAPSPAGQAELIRAALHLAGRSPHEIRAVECHGTATALGDAVELTALADVFGDRRDAPLWLSSVKANIGHLDAAAGLAGALRAVDVVRTGTLPRLPTAVRPREEVGAGRPLAVPLEDVRLGAAPVVGVSSFGLGGTSAHVILAPATAPLRRAADRALPVVFASGRTIEDAERDAADAIDAMAGSSELDPASLVRSDPGLPHRVALDRRTRARVCSGAPTSSRVALLFPGGGTRRGLPRCWARLPEVCVAVVERGLAAARQAGFDRAPDASAWLADLRGREAHEDEFARQIVDTVLCSVATAVWLRDQGLEPAAVVGHSYGEYAAAVTAGVLTIEDAIRLAIARAEVFRTSEPGRMVVAFAGADALLAVLDDPQIAAINGPELTVLTGSRAEIDSWIAALEAHGIKWRALDIAVAAHAPTLQGRAHDYAAVVDSVERRRPQLAFWSTATGRRVDGELQEVAYWVDQLYRPVLFGGVIEALAADGLVLVDVGPGTVLAGAIDAGGFAAPIDVVSSDAAHLAVAPGGLAATDVLHAALWVRGLLPRPWSSSVGPAASRARRPPRSFGGERAFTPPTRIGTSSQEASPAVPAAPAAKPDANTDIAAIVRAAVAHVLAIEQSAVVPERSFVALGGSSFQALSVSRALTTRLGRRVGIRTILGARDLGALIRELDGALAS